MEDIKSTYKIKTRTLILTEYNEFLYQLYLPLIGHKAVFLYEYLTNELRYGKTKMSLEEILERSSFIWISLGVIPSMGLKTPCRT